MKKIIGSLFLIVIGMLPGCRGEYANVEKGRQIKEGMTIDEVKAILGEPLKSRPGYNDTSKLMFLYGTGVVSAGDVEVYFEKEHYRVTKVLFPE